MYRIRPIEMHTNSGIELRTKCEGESNLSFISVYEIKFDEIGLYRDREKRGERERERRESRAIVNIAYIELKCFEMHTI